MYGGMMSGFGPIMMLIHLGLVIYFFYLLTVMAKSLSRIADKVDKLPLLSNEGEKKEQ